MDGLSIVSGLFLSLPFIRLPSSRVLVHLFRPSVAWATSGNVVDCPQKKVVNVTRELASIAGGSKRRLPMLCVSRAQGLIEAPQGLSIILGLSASSLTMVNRSPQALSS